MTELMVQTWDAPADPSVVALTGAMIQKIQSRAFETFREHNSGQGFALKDWVSAERDLYWPCSELRENDKAYVLKLAMAGFRSKDINVTATPKELIVSAKSETAAHDSTGRAAEQICWSEFRTDEVFRRFQCPTDIAVDKVTAHYENGMLVITARKASTTSSAII